jgi:hypothetical protein
MKRERDVGKKPSKDFGTQKGKKTTQIISNYLHRVMIKIILGIITTRGMRLRACVAFLSFFKFSLWMMNTNEIVYISLEGMLENEVQQV